MAELIKQPTLQPTRKLWAIIISGAIIGTIKTLLSIYWPDNPLDPYMQDFGFWVEGGLMVIAGYMTRNKA